MKSKYSFFLIVLALVFGFSWNFSYAQSVCSGSEDNINGMPRVLVEKRSAWFQGNPLDHTYVKFVEDGGNWEAYGCFGRCEGGETLNLTESFTHSENRQIVNFMTSSEPCKWPDYAYLVFGVCHQLANRGLYFTNKKVKEAFGYKLSSLIYKTYGWESINHRDYWMDECLETSQNIVQWKEGSPDDKMKSVQSIDPELEIYKNFSKNIKNLKSNNDKINEIQAYNDRLLKYYIDERIGRNKSGDYFLMLKMGHDSFAEEKNKLDKKLMQQGKITNEIIEEYNKIINSYLSYAQEKMSKKDYQSFFGMEQNVEVDMRSFLPISLSNQLN
jgi:hypothetical protein